MRSILPAVCILTLLGCAEANPDDGENDVIKPTKSANLRDVPCTDQSISMLMLYDEPASGKIREEGEDPDGFVSYVDATGGGLNATQSFVYARFTDKGLVKVALSDDDAFESLDWDIAFRRYVVRVNSGVSGPGEVTVARTAPKTQFADLKAVPANLDLRTEQYFTEDGCELVADGSGLNAPATALASFWTYQNCVQMTKNVYVLALPKKRHVKLEVLSYYSPENQKVCDATGKVPMTASGAGNVRVRWNFLP
ncbi:MAG TPA: HmuY family protein [Polyangiales bacterium]|nr:HmuY family protein [Polyangiales bacterium]